MALVMIYSLGMVIYSDLDYLAGIGGGALVIFYVVGGMWERE